MLPPAPAVSDPAGETAPPSQMSSIGGELLSRPGTQVQPLTGAPQLPEDLSAKSWIVADAESGDVLAAHNAHWPLAPASTIKMLLADTLLPKFDRDELYRARPEHFADMGPGSSAVGIADYQTYTVEDLWHGVFLASGNDAAYALAALNGGKERTVEEMNERAAELQALDTHVINPDGYDAPGQVSSAYDLTLIARSGMQNPDFREYAATPTAQFPGAGSGPDRGSYEIQSTNRLLVGDQGLDPYPGIAGIKNGYTSSAGYTFTGVAERDGRVLLVTVMDPRGDGLQVYREAADLLDWGFRAADMVEPVGELVPPLSELEERTGAQGPQAGGGDDAGAGDGSNGETAPRDGASGGEGGSASGMTVLVVAAVSMAVLAAAAYLFHRRNPLPAAGRRTPQDEPDGSDGTDGTDGTGGPDHRGTAAG
nr:serine hydrolase [Streptomyces sp. 7-21]